MLAYNDKFLNNALVGFVERCMQVGRMIHCFFFVERNVEDGSVLDYEVEGDWILRSEIKDRKNDSSGCYWSWLWKEFIDGCGLLCSDWSWMSRFDSFCLQQHQFVTSELVINKAERCSTFELKNHINTCIALTLHIKLLPYSLRRLLWNRGLETALVLCNWRRAAICLPNFPNVLLCLRVQS